MTDSVVVLVHAVPLGETLSVIVMTAGAPGQVKTGVALAALSKAPAVAVQANVGVTDPAAALAERETEPLRVASNDDTLIPLMFAQTWVVAPTTIVPESAAPPVQTRVTLTGVEAPAATLKLDEPAQVRLPSADVRTAGGAAGTTDERSGRNRGSDPYRTVHEKLHGDIPFSW